MASLKFKYCGITKRVRVEKEISALHFSDIREQATELFPAISGDTLISFIWEDEEGDKVDSSSDKEIQEAVRTMTSLGKPSTFEIQISTSAFSKATIRGESEIKGSAYYAGDHMLKDVVDLSQTISGISREESVLNQMLRGYFTGPQGERLYAVVKLQYRDRNILREKEIYKALQDKAVSSNVSTGCVYMYPSPDGYLTVEDFGTDIRQYFDPESAVLQSNIKKLIAAVKCLHDVGYAHCDIKPANILVREVRRAVFEFKLCDLDCATRIGEEFQQLGKFTRAWVSPEMYLHR